MLYQIRSVGASIIWHTSTGWPHSRPRAANSARRGHQSDTASRSSTLIDLILSLWYGLLEIIHETYLKGAALVQRRLARPHVQNDHAEDCILDMDDEGSDVHFLIPTGGRKQA